MKHIGLIIIFVLLMNDFVQSNEIINASESCGTSFNGIVHKHTTVGGIFFLNMSKKITTEDFLKNAEKIHGSEYDYSKSYYAGCKKKIIIICKKHGEFRQLPYCHLRRKQGCPMCKGNKISLSLLYTKQEFIDKSISMHGNKYDYSKIRYIDGKHKVKIICQKHGIFRQYPHDHLSGRGCKLCGRERIGNFNRSNINEFIKKSKLKHGDKYDYSLADYKNSHVKIKIICKKHGAFDQLPTEHMKGSGCSKCYRDRQIINQSLDHMEFIKRAKALHNNKYDYSLAEYTKARNKIKIICPIHGIFEHTANSHLMGHGCKLCANKFIGNKRYLSTEEFIKISKLTHGEKYDYSLVNYKAAHAKVDIICPTHGVFSQISSNHSHGQGCPDCNNCGNVSRNKLFGKLKIAFSKYAIIREGRPKWLHLKTASQSLDIYFPNYNIAIEYQGDQHFKAIDFFGGEKAHKLLKSLDQRKYSLCSENGCKLFYFTYRQKNIPLDYIDKVYSNENKLIEEIKKQLLKIKTS